MASGCLTLALGLTATWTRAAEPDCAETLALSGTDAEDLRAMLSARDELEQSPMCERAVVVVARVGEGYRVSLTLGGDRVTREVATLLDCATWIETWLSPVAEVAAERGEQKPSPLASASSSGGDVDPRRDRLDTLRGSEQAPSVVGRSTLAGVGVAAEDATLWAGGELAGQLIVYDRIWFGAAVAGLEDLSTRLDDEGIHRRLARASVRVGGRWRPARAFVIDAGVGGGLLSALASIDTGTEKEDEDEGAGFGEVAASAAYGWSERWQVVVGVTLAGVVGIGERDDDEGLEALLPDAHPDFLGGLVVGVGCDVARVH